MGNVDVWIQPKWITAISEEHCVIGYSGEKYKVFSCMATVGAEESGAKSHLLSRVHFRNSDEDSSGSMLVAHNPEILVGCIQKLVTDVPIHPSLGAVVNNFENSE